MVDEDIGRRFHRIIGVGNVISVPPPSPGYQAQWQWYTGAYDSVRYVIDTLRPWLGKRRRAQIRRVLKNMEHYKRTRTR